MGIYFEGSYQLKIGIFGLLLLQKYFQNLEKSILYCVQIGNLNVGGVVGFQGRKVIKINEKFFSFRNYIWF